jgi:hypothetical protein
LVEANPRRRRHLETRRDTEKLEAQNPKQIQMIQTLQIQNEAKSDSLFCIFRVLNFFAPVCFGFRNSNFAYSFAGI